MLPRRKPIGFLFIPVCTAPTVQYILIYVLDWSRQWVLMVGYKSDEQHNCQIGAMHDEPDGVS